MRKVLVINTTRDGYSPAQVAHTMTVSELRAMLNSYADDMEVYLAFDNQYTFGGIEEEMMEEYDDDDDDEGE